MDECKATAKPTPVYKDQIARLVGGAGVPMIIGTGYGLYQMFKLGVGTVHSLQTYVPLLGGIAAMLGIGAYSRVITKPKVVSWPSALSAMAGFIPYMYGCYLTFYLGFWSLKSQLEGFSLLRLTISLAWIFLGYRSVKKLWILTEVSRAIDSGKVEIVDYS